MWERIARQKRRNGAGGSGARAETEREGSRAIFECRHLKDRRGDFSSLLPPDAVKASRTPGLSVKFAEGLNDPRLHHRLLTRRYDTRLKGPFETVLGGCAFWQFLFFISARTTGEETRRNG
jgi:hypothetical protein